MVKKFIYPDFSTGDIEIRQENNKICIYASEDGLKKLISICELLGKKAGDEHIHLEDYSVLTQASLGGVIAKFSKP